MVALLAFRALMVSVTSPVLLATNEMAPFEAETFKTPLGLVAKE